MRREEMARGGGGKNREKGHSPLAEKCEKNTPICVFPAGDVIGMWFKHDMKQDILQNILETTLGT